MSEISREWIAKAEGDRVTALRELRARNAPNYDATCFHAQQAIEKLMKAFLLQHRMSFKRIHDLEVLLDSCVQQEPILGSLHSEAQLLTQYAVQFRYPGESADKTEAKQAVQAMHLCWDSLMIYLEACSS